MHTIAEFPDNSAKGGSPVKRRLGRLVCTAVLGLGLTVVPLSTNALALHGTGLCPTFEDGTLDSLCKEETDNLVNFVFDEAERLYNCFSANPPGTWVRRCI